MSLDVMVADPSMRVPLGTQTGDSAGRVANAQAQGSHPDDIRRTAESSPATSEIVLSAKFRDFLELTKPRIVTMILVTTLIAAVVAAGGATGFWLLFHLFVGVGMVAGSAGAMNQVWEHKIDAEMERTKRRPLPAGRMAIATAASFSVLLGVVGTAYLTYFCGITPAMVGVATWIAYVPIYTPLKTRSAWNTTVGAVSGALPVLIGYTAAGGSLADGRGWLLFGVLAAWQYPHFMAIAWLYRRQYSEAGFQMTTTVEPTGRSAGWQSIVGMIALIACLVGLATYHWSSSELLTYVWIAALLLVSFPMSRAAWLFAKDRNDVTARKLLRASLLQLPASLLLVTASALVY